MTQALFTLDGARLVPNPLTRGPWDAAAMHGGPASALLARAIERFEDGERMFTMRIGVDLLRPVPLAPLEVRVRWERPGKRVQLVGASLLANDVEVARATGLRMRRETLALDEPLQPALAPPPPPEAGRDRADRAYDPEREVLFHLAAVEHRVVAGDYDQRGPATDWMRLRLPFVAGEETSPLCRAVITADFGNGLSAQLLRSDGYTFINADLTVALHRYPVGEWVCLEARSELSPASLSLVDSRLWDEQGPIGRALQSLLIARR